MSHRSFFISAAFVVLLCSFSARAQEPAPATGSDKSAAAATKEKAVDLLRTIAGQVGSLRSAQNRARIGSNAADLFWEIDEERSRRLFSTVAEDINAGFAEATVDSKSLDSQQYDYYQTFAVFGQLRSDTLERIARHDPQLALEFLRVTRLPPDMKLPYGMADAEMNLELRLAGQIAAKSPELALKLGRQALAGGLRPDLVSVLTQLKPGDRSAWQSFYKEIVDKLKTVNLAEDYQAETLALDLANAFSPPQADEQAYRELIGVLVTSALSQGCAGADGNGDARICFRMGSLFQTVEKYYPARAPAFRSVGEQAAELKIREEIRSLMDKVTIDEAPALAKQYPDWEDQIYWRVVMKALAADDYAKAREIAMKVEDEELRRNMLAQIKFTESMGATIASDIDAQRGSNEPRSTEERLDSIMKDAIRIRNTDRKGALERFDQAGQIIESVKPGTTKLEMQIGLAVMYVSLQSDRGFTIVESMMPRLNELISAAAALDGVETNYLSEGEWNMTGHGNLGSLLTALAQNAGYFSRMNFDRSLALANQLERNEVRLMAQLMMVQGVLSDRDAGLRTMPRN